MKTYDYMVENPNANMLWCVPYLSEDERVCVVVCEGKPIRAVVEGAEVELPKDEQSAWEFVCRLVCDEETIELYKTCNGGAVAKNDFRRIADEFLHEIGCAACPFIRECGAMDEDVE